MATTMDNNVPTFTCPKVTEIDCTTNHRALDRAPLLPTLTMGFPLGLAHAEVDHLRRTEAHLLFRRRKC